MSVLYSPLILDGIRGLKEGGERIRERERERGERRERGGGGRGSEMGKFSRER